MQSQEEYSNRYKNIIDQAWESNSQENKDFLKNTIEEILQLLDQGRIRVAQKTNDQWVTNLWIKKAILLSFKLNDSYVQQGTPQIGNDVSNWFDKVRPKMLGWSQDEFKQAGFRAVPGSFVRRSAYVAKNVVLMPSFINVGAFVGEGTMVDTWVTIGSCAQIGANCHISGGVGIGGVLEPLQANPVIIEDNCFIGARSEIAEGVIVGEGAVISMGVFIGASTKIIDRNTGEIFYGRVPPYSVVVPGSLPGKPLPDGSQGPALYAAVIVKRVDEKTRSKTSINELLRNNND